MRTAVRSIRSRPTLALVTACAVALLVPPTPAAAQHGALEERVDRVFAEFDRPGSPGCALGVVRGGRLVYERGYGYASLEHAVPHASSTVFYLASVSKQFTAAAIALLADQGRISLDDDVRDFVPELPDYGHRITIRHLVHHTSGIRDYLGLMMLAGMRFEDVHPDEDVLALLARQRALNFEPGTEYVYNNSGYFLMSVIVERVTGKTLRQFADEHVFRPLGMADTHFHDDRTMVVPRRAMAYSPAEADTYRLNFWTNFDKVGSGGLLGSVRDLYLWDRNLDEDVLAGGRLPELLTTRGVLNHGDTLDYAFGLIIGEYRGLRTVQHGGSSMGFRTQFLRFPDERFTVICLCNVSTANATRLALQVADIYLEDRLAPVTAERVAPDAEREAAAEPAAAASLSDFLGDYYGDELDVTYRIGWDEDRLVLHRRNADPTPIQPRGPDTFRAGPITLAFDRDDDGIVAGFTIDAGRVRGIRMVRTRR